MTFVHRTNAIPATEQVELGGLLRVFICLRGAMHRAPAQSLVLQRSPSSKCALCARQTLTFGNAPLTSLAAEQTRHAANEKSQNGEQHIEGDRDRNRNVQRGQQFLPFGFVFDDGKNVEGQRKHETAQEYPKLARHTTAGD